jgi:hypothetical protein
VTVLLADAIKAGVITRPLTEDEKWARDDILNAAVEWHDGRMTLGMFATVGPVPAWNSKGQRYDSVGWGRALALFSTPHDDPRWHALNAAINALVEAQDVTVTRQGVFDRAELVAHGVTVR